MNVDLNARKMNNVIMGFVCQFRVIVPHVTNAQVIDRAYLFAMLLSVRHVYIEARRRFVHLNVMRTSVKHALMEFV